MPGPLAASLRVLAPATVLVVAVGCAAAEPVQRPRGTVTTVVTAPQQGGVGDEAAADTGRELAPPIVDDEAAADADRAAADAGAAEAAAVDRIAARLPAGSGIALAPVGRAGEVRVAGDLRSDVAWSTIKVPLAIAALRVSPGSVGEAESAITVSDNTAAEGLWDALGEGAGAAAAVEAVLDEAGDPTTTVPAEHRRPGYSVFGQTDWPLADQARFAAGMACLPAADPVRRMMHRIDPSQRWGLGHAPGAAFKGGWGPTADGSRYLVRQFGLIPSGDGMTAVAIAAYGPGLDAGAAQLTGIAEVVADEVHALPSGRCP